MTIGGRVGVGAFVNPRWVDARMVVFSSRNFHEIRPVRAGTRLTQSSFIGLTTGNDLVFWS